MKRRNLFAGAAVMALTTTLPAAAQAAKYKFTHILWGMSDANVQFHVNAAKKYMADHPNVEITFVGPQNYDPAEHAKFLDTVINSKPDGIAMHISSVDALLPGLQAAKAAGIPFVSVTSHPPSAEDNAKLEGLILTWVGADESKIGGALAKRVLQEGKPTHVAYFTVHKGHAGNAMRAKSFFETLEGVPHDEVVTSEDPQAAMDAMRAYLTKNPDVDVVFGNAPQNKWMVDVVAELGRPIKILTSDDAPSSLDCILQDTCFASFTQQFPIQAPFAYETLLQYKETGMAPIGPIVTGPAVIDKSNADKYKVGAMEVFGEDGYKKLSPF